MKELNNTLEQINNDISNLKKGKSIMLYMEDLDVKFVEVPNMNLIYISKMVQYDSISKLFCKSLPL